MAEARLLVSCADRPGIIAAISQFLHERDANIVSSRTAADLEATRAAYRTGRLTNGGGGLARTPIIEYRNYTDDQPNGDLHLRY